MENAQGGPVLKAEYSDPREDGQYANQVEEALDRVLRSDSFRRARRLRDLLSYVVRAAVDGKSTDERRIARELFAKSGDFSPTLDPIIRVHFGRLRRSLARYYVAEGQQDPVIIEIPSRSYAPRFRFRGYGHRVNAKDSPVLVVDASANEAKPGKAVNESGGAQSVAVLPFANLTNDPKQDAFCYGLTEEISTALAAIPSVDVVASSSSFQFKDEHFDVREVGRDLGVMLILEGSVRMERGQTRVTAQLARCGDGVAIWSESFDGKVNGSLNTQRTMARRVLENLPLGN